MSNLKEIAEKLDIDKSRFDSEDWSYIIPIILKIQSEGSTFFMKVDSEREKNISTIIIEGGLLGDDYIRCETSDIIQGISQVVTAYSKKFWN